MSKHDEKQAELAHSNSDVESDGPPTIDVTSPTRYPVKWYRSTYYNAIILGLCNFCAPGIWVRILPSYLLRNGEHPLNKLSLGSNE